jgi:selenocysteine lyase/cysteine desulfurase
VPAARSRFARYLGVPAGHVALMGSVAEAATTVAMSLPERNGTILVGDDEFRSNLFPWFALRARVYRIIRVTRHSEELRPLLPSWRTTADRGRPSHIVAVTVTDPDAVRRRLASMRVRARILGDRLRVGFHYFNDADDVTAALHVLTG